MAHAGPAGGAAAAAASTVTPAPVHIGLAPRLNRDEVVARLRQSVKDGGTDEFVNEAIHLGFKETYRLSDFLGYKDVAAAAPCAANNRRWAPCLARAIAEDIKYARDVTEPALEAVLAGDGGTGLDLKEAKKCLDSLQEVRTYAATVPNAILENVKADRSLCKHPILDELNNERPAPKQLDPDWPCAPYADWMACEHIIKHVNTPVAIRVLQHLEQAMTQIRPQLHAVADMATAMSSEENNMPLTTATRIVDAADYWAAALSKRLKSSRPADHTDTATLEAALDAVETAGEALEPAVALANKALLQRMQQEVDSLKAQRQQDLTRVKAVLNVFGQPTGASQAEQGAAREGLKAAQEAAQERRRLKDEEEAAAKRGKATQAQARTQRNHDAQVQANKDRLAEQEAAAAKRKADEAAAAEAEKQRRLDKQRAFQDQQKRAKEKREARGAEADRGKPAAPVVVRAAPAKPTASGSRSLKAPQAKPIASGSQLPKAPRVIPVTPKPAAAPVGSGAAVGLVKLRIATPLASPHIDHSLKRIAEDQAAQVQLQAELLAFARSTYPTVGDAKDELQVMLSVREAVRALWADGTAVVPRGSRSLLIGDGANTFRAGLALPSADYDIMLCRPEAQARPATAELDTLKTSPLGSQLFYRQSVTTTVPGRQAGEVGKLQKTIGPEIVNPQGRANAPALLKGNLAKRPEVGLDVQITHRAAAEV